MPAVKVTRCSSPMKIVVEQNLCKLFIFSNTNLALCFNEKRNLEFSRTEKPQNGSQKTNLCTQTCKTLLTPFTFSSMPPKPMSKTCRDDFYILSAVSSPESSMPQANLDSEWAMLSSSQSFTMSLIFFIIISGLESIKDIILIAQ